MSSTNATMVGGEKSASDATASSWRREFQGYAIAGVLCVLVLVLYFQLWKADLSVPISYRIGGDYSFNGFVIKMVVDTGWVLHNPLLGAPDGLEFYDFPAPNNLHLITIKLIALITKDYGVTLNLYYFLQFLLTTWSGLFVFRQFGVSSPLAVAGSMLYAFLPYHIWRGQGHLFLADYAVIPLAAMVMLWVCEGKPIFWAAEGQGMPRWRWSGPKAVLSTIMCILLSACGPYYAFFGAFFLLIAGLIGFARTRSASRVLDGMCLVALISALFLANMTPFIWYARAHGRNPEVAIRDPGDAIIHGLSITHLLAPTPGHRIPALTDDLISHSKSVKEFYERLSQVHHKYEFTENKFNSLGILGSCGFLALISVLLIGESLPRGLELLSSLSKLNVAAVLLAVPKSFSFIFAKLVSPQIRAYNRISIYIGFFAIFALVLIADFVRRRWARTRRVRVFFSLCLGAGLVVGLLDQTPSIFVPDHVELSREFAADAAFVRRIEWSLLDRAMVFQLPYMRFPESGPIFKMTDYDHFMPYFHSSKLRWSYGAMKGRATDGWQRQIASLPTRAMVTALARAGFGAIYIDRNGYSDSGAGLEAELSQIVQGDPIVSADRRYCVYRLQPASTPPD